MKIKLKLILVLLSTIIISTTATSNENSKGLNFYTGMFDFSDDGKRAALYGVEHKMKIYIEIRFLEEFLQLQAL